MKVAVLGADSAEASHLRTLRAIAATGAEVLSLSFRRRNMTQGGPRTWTETDLGLTANGLGPRRLAMLGVGLWRLARERRRLSGADLLIARNLDMALLGLIAMALWAPRARLVYQCLDIHPALTRPGPARALLRAAERAVLARSARVVVSSSRFAAEHFARQRPAAPLFLVENRILWTGAPPPRPPLRARRRPGPLRLGWVGSLRCPHSLDLLAATAATLGATVEVRLRGVLHRHAMPGCDAILAAHPNIVFDGPYDYPSGLDDAYRDLDLVWGQEMSAPGGNTDWLLPNRLYEAGYFGVPLLAVAGTETARRIAADGGGFVLPRAGDLTAFLSARPYRLIAASRARLLRRPASDFCAPVAEAAAMLDLDTPPPERNRIHAAA